jgi:thiamine biosynthesis lipoprotein
MKKQAVIMGMPVTVNVVDKAVTDEDINEIFSYFHHIDNKFSTYKKNSEISQINKGVLKGTEYSNEMKKILFLSEKTRKETNGYFDININGILDPSGIVKGYAIFEAAKALRVKGFDNFYVEIAGDIQVYGKNEKNDLWKIGIQNPFNLAEVVKVVKLKDKGIATSGNYIRGNHIFNPKQKNKIEDIVSITVIGPNVYEADRFATAVFAMGKKGIGFIEKLKGFEGYMIQKDKKAVYTSGFENYIILN